MSLLSSDPRSLGFEAFVYLYPLVTMEVTRRQQINIDADERPGFGSRTSPPPPSVSIS